MNIVVTSNCQTHGIADALKFMMPKANVYPIWSLSGASFINSELSKLNLNELIWITSLSGENQQEIKNNNSMNFTKIIKIPEIFFDAFHPDMTYVPMKSGDVFESAIGHYHSKIGLYMYFLGAKPSDFFSYFNDEVFYSLGYLDMWERSVNSLRASIRNSDLNENFMDPIIESKKKFMHTFNHPNLATLALLAKEITRLCNENPQVEWDSWASVTRDGLFENGSIFPYYPGVAARFGESGSYLSRTQDGVVYNLSRYLSETFEKYKDLNKNEILNLEEILSVSQVDFLKNLRGE